MVKNIKTLSEEDEGYVGEAVCLLLLGAQKTFVKVVRKILGQRRQDYPYKKKVFHLVNRIVEGSKQPYMMKNDCTISFGRNPESPLYTARRIYYQLEYITRSYAESYTGDDSDYREPRKGFLSDEITSRLIKEILESI